MFCLCLFKDITLCRSLVICLVCGVTFQKLRLYEYSVDLRYSDSDFLVGIFGTAVRRVNSGIYWY